MSRKARATMRPEDDIRCAASGAKLCASIRSVEETVRKAKKFTAALESGVIASDGIVMTTVNDNDSLVIHMETARRVTRRTGT